MGKIALSSTQIHLFNHGGSRYRYNVITSPCIIYVWKVHKRDKIIIKVAIKIKKE